jgi:hypothetical protein
MFNLPDNFKDKICSNNAGTEDDLNEENIQHAASPVLPAKPLHAVNKVVFRHNVCL